MKHVIAFDMSKGKSSRVIYYGYRQCEFEGVLYHTRVDFERLLKLMNNSFKLYLKRQVFIQKPWKHFLEITAIHTVV